MVILRSWRIRLFRRRRDIEALAVLAGDPHPKVRAEAVNALWGLSERMDEPQRTRALAALRAAASDADSVVRANAVAGLATLHAPEAQGLVLAGLADPDWYVRTLSASAVHDIPDPGAAVAKLVELLDDDEPFVRQVAAGRLGQVGEPRAVQPLRARLTKEREPEVRQAIEEALTSLEGRTSPSGPQGQSLS
ncbi:MAG: HEAT repeat domain-containing protein [Actinomycetota bacterium]